MIRPSISRSAPFVVILALSSPTSCAQQVRQKAPLETFQKFWSEFRDAVLAENKTLVASMTKFPFTTRGTLDSDPVKTLDRASFLDSFTQLLDQDPGLSRQPDTMRRLIERTQSVSSKHLGDGDQTARVGQFVFRRTGEQWLFTLAYIEE
jgi:hypothetical protein